MINPNPQTLGHAQSAYDAVIIDDLYEMILHLKADYLVLDTQTITIVRHGHAPVVRHVVNPSDGHSTRLEVLGRLMPETKAPYVIDAVMIAKVGDRLPFVSDESQICHSPR